MNMMNLRSIPLLICFNDDKTHIFIDYSNNKTPPKNEIAPTFQILFILYKFRNLFWEPSYSEYRMIPTLKEMTLVRLMNFFFLFLFFFTGYATQEKKRFFFYRGITLVLLCFYRNDDENADFCEDSYW